MALSDKERETESSEDEDGIESPPPEDVLAENSTAEEL